MSELRTILKNANKNSIILGDELCSGTESTSALSIFVSGLEVINKIESSYIFATHFHEILDYEEIKFLLKNKMEIFHMSVIFDREKNKLIYDRKLKKGSGETMYGLEVCKSLDLPDDFLDRAYFIRKKYNATINSDSILNKGLSKYNSNKIKGLWCEICKNNKSTEVHHLQFQKNANNNGIINSEFHKNNKANLINICEDCHNKIHNENIEYKYIKTNDGYELTESDDGESIIYNNKLDYKINNKKSKDKKHELLI
jgi:DNA mismatch repair protein MutS